MFFTNIFVWKDDSGLTAGDEAHEPNPYAFNYQCELETIPRQGEHVTWTEYDTKTEKDILIQVVVLDVTYHLKDGVIQDVMLFGRRVQHIGESQHICSECKEKDLQKQGKLF